jgi:hypothetical protein
MDRNGRTSYATLTITKKPDGTLAGKWGSAELEDVKLDGGKLTFTRTLRFNDQDFKLTYEGTLKDGAIAGTLSSERGSFAANAARRKPISPAVGRWAFQYKVGDRDISATFVVSQGAGGLEGRWTSSASESVVSNIKFEDGKLTFDRKVKLQDVEIETTYDGVVTGDKITGTIKSDRGEFPANAERLGAALIGKWDLTTTSQERGPRPGMLVVFPDLSGRYETFGGEIPVKEIQLDGNNVAFSVEAGFGDQSFTLDFKAKIDGKSLTGEVVSPRGSRAVTGKKVEAPAPEPSPIVGTWELTREGRDGQRTAKLVIKEDMTASYAHGPDAAPVSVADLRFEGGELSFKVTVKRGERDVALEFKGKVEGTALKGQLTTPRGMREVKGKKAPAAPGSCTKSRPTCAVTPANHGAAADGSSGARVASGSLAPVAVRPQPAAKAANTSARAAVTHGAGSESRCHLRGAC